MTNPGVVPLHQHPAKLFLREQREIGNTRRRRLHRAFEQGDEVSDQPLDRRRLEELRAVVERAPQSLRALVHDQHQIRLHRRIVEGNRREAEIRERERLARRVLEVEDHLKQRRSARITLGMEPLHQPLEGRILVSIRPEADLAHPSNQVLKRQLRRDLHPEHQRVDEEPEQRLGLGPGAIGNRGSNDDVRLPGVPVQEHVERRVERHEQRRSLAARELGQPVRELSPSSKRRRAPREDRPSGAACRSEAR